MLKKTIALFGLVASSFAFAGTMGPVCTPGNVTVPCEFRRWDIGLQGLYLRPTYSGIRGYMQGNAPLPISRINREDNKWDWGFRLEGSYHFNTGNDVTVDWTHFRGDVNQGGLEGFALILNIPNQPLNLIGRNRLDQVNLVLGQTADFSAVKTMRFYGGLQLAHIQVNDTGYFTMLVSPVPLPPGTPLLMEQNDNNDYRGLGPVAGIDYAYRLTEAFSITATGAGSILVGQSHYTNRFVATGLGLVLAGVNGNQNLVVPSVEGKLGVNYAHPMYEGVLHLQLGYEAINYFHSLQSRGFTQLSLPASNNIDRSSYGVYGPYFGLKYVGNA